MVMSVWGSDIWILQSYNQVWWYQRFPIDIHHPMEASTTVLTPMPVKIAVVRAVQLSGAVVVMGGCCGGGYGGHWSSKRAVGITPTHFWCYFKRYSVSSPYLSCDTSTDPFPIHVHTKFMLICGPPSTTCPGSHGIFLASMPPTLSYMPLNV